MKRHKIIGCLVLVSAFLACDPNDATTAEPSAIDFIFEDGFETQNNTIDELFKSDGSRWTTIQQDDPTNAVNEI